MELLLLLFFLLTLPFAMTVFFYTTTVSEIVDNQRNPFWTLRFEFFLNYPKIIFFCLTGYMQYIFIKQRKPILSCNVIMVLGWGLIYLGYKTT